jgi:hypothetical protein
MNLKQAYQLGLESGREAARLGNFSPDELKRPGVFMAACRKICRDKRRDAEHSGHGFDRRPNAKSLWDAFLEGEGAWIIAGWLERRPKVL